MFFDFLKSQTLLGPIDFRLLEIKLSQIKLFAINLNVDFIWKIRLNVNDLKAKLNVLLL